MPPKLSKAAKQDLILAHIRSTRTCHTLKDLEKALPSVASINGIQVKEYIQALTDEGKLRVEKIGTGNWYWSFVSDEVKAREAQLEQAKREVKKLQTSCEEGHNRLVELRGRQEMEDERESCGERDMLMGIKAGLKEEVALLRAKLAEAEESQGKSVTGMKDEIKEFKAQAHQWTDNIYTLEGYLRRLAGGDPEIVRAVQRECYGEEFSEEEEGLRELDGA